MPPASPPLCPLTFVSQLQCGQPGVSAPCFYRGHQARDLVCSSGTAAMEHTRENARSCADSAVTLGDYRVTHTTSTPYWVTRMTLGQYWVLYDLEEYRVTCMTLGPKAPLTRIWDVSLTIILLCSLCSQALHLSLELILNFFFVYGVREKSSSFSCRWLSSFLSTIHRRETLGRKSNTNQSVGLFLGFPGEQPCSVTRATAVKPGLGGGPERGFHMCWVSRAARLPQPHPSAALRLHWSL